jgi:parvulin-like peptidyl-prolyl isomerase
LVKGLVVAGVGVVAAALLSAACSNDRTASTTATASATHAAATVNGVALAKSDFDADMKDYAANADFLATGQAGDDPHGVSADFVRKTLQADILFEMVRQEVVKRGLTPPPDDDPAVRAQTIGRFDQSGSSAIFDAFPKRFQDRALQQSAALVALQNALGGGPVDAAKVRAAYDADPRRFGQICARQIQVSDQADAQRIYGELQQGADFATVVTHESEDPAAGSTGGKLLNPDGSCPRAAQLDADFAAGALAAQPGVPTAPIQTKLGWHIIVVDSVTPLPFDQVQDDAAAAARKAVVTAATPEVNKILQTGVRAPISVNPAYGVWDPVGHQVVAPGSAPPATTGAPAASSSSGGT